MLKNALSKIEKYKKRKLVVTACEKEDEYKEKIKRLEREIE
jgi:hypothetical protein